jgi:thiamine-monophosphate kinase
MRDMKEIFENITIDSWVQHFLRSPHQFNKPHDSDSELIEIPGNLRDYLAVTIDTVAEEITSGLYRDPYTMGWVTVMACSSDLAAVGAEPLGLVISASIEPGRDKTFTDSIARGMEDACRNLGVFILGGDTNITPTISLTSCALGLVPRENAMTRRGCQPGDDVFITGGLGIGNALGLVRLTNLPGDYFPEEIYRPVAHIKEGQILRPQVKCCMDTSDGLLTTLDQLMRLNKLGFVINCEWESILAPEVLELCNKTRTPPWLMIAGPHGEFKLLFTISSGIGDKILTRPDFQGINLIRLGKVQEKPVVSMVLPSGKRVDIDMAPIRNLLETTQGDLGQYVKEFRAIGKKYGLE